MSAVVTKGNGYLPACVALIVHNNLSRRFVVGISTLAINLFGAVVSQSGSACNDAKRSTRGHWPNSNDPGKPTDFRRSCPHRIKGTFFNGIGRFFAGRTNKKAQQMLGFSFEIGLRSHTHTCVQRHHNCGIRQKVKHEF